MKRFVRLGGDYGGQEFKPLPWFVDFIREIYGPRNPEGLRLREDVYLELTKGSAKTTNIAALIVTDLCLEKTTGNEIYTAATTRKQAAITFRYAEQMVLASVELKRWLKTVPSQKRIYKKADPSSFFEALSSDAGANDGMAPRVVIRDEYHLWHSKSSRELSEVLEKSAGAKRKNPLVIDITTAGKQDEAQLCWNRHKYTLAWREGAISNPRFYGIIYAADQKRMEEDDNYWTTKEARLEANAAHEDRGGHIKDTFFANMVEEARTDPVKRAAYQRYHLNYWGVHVESVIDFPTWLKCNGDIDMRTWPVYDYQLAMSRWGLKGQTCFLGLDIGSTADLTALVAGFPPEGLRTKWAFLAWYWMPKSKVEFRTVKDQVPYQRWVETGFISAHDKPKTNPLDLLPQIKKCVEMFRVQELCYDPWNAQELIKRVEMGDEKGKDVVDVTCVEVPQNFAHLNEPTKWLLNAYQNSELIHGNNEVLNWNARNLGLKRDSNNNIRVHKPGDESPKKIDGMSALVTLMRRALVAQKVVEAGAYF